jgi:hypothetical protein
VRGPVLAISYLDYDEDCKSGAGLWRCRPIAICSRMTEDLKKFIPQKI